MSLASGIFPHMPIRELPLPGRGIVIPGGQSAIDAALRACAKENAGKVVGNPTSPKQWVKTVDYKGDGKKYSLIWIEDLADPDGWWHEYARVHGHEVILG